MTGEYKTLARLFHADRSHDAFTNHNRLAITRLEADSTFRTGIRTPLGELFIAMPRQMSITIERILVDERTISRMWHDIPGVMRGDYIRHGICEELLATNTMEGVRSTRKEVEAAIDAARKTDTGTATVSKRHGNAAKKPRFMEFAKLYLGLSDAQASFPQTLEAIRDIYDKVALDEIPADSKPDGELFSLRDVGILGPHGDCIHTGVSGENRISVMLTEMINLVDSDTMPALVSAIAAHFLFEYVHPFYDGNGRTGRYLLALSLKRVLTLPTVLSLSRIIAENKEAYYKAFSEAEDKLNCGELTFFVLTILRLIGTAQQELINELGIKLDQLTKAKSQCDTMQDALNLSRNATTILFQIMQEQLFDSRTSVSLEEAADHLKLSKQSARKYVDELSQHSLIDFVHHRPLRFKASATVIRNLEGEAPESTTTKSATAQSAAPQSV